MHVLGLDTSTQAGSLALVEGSQLIADYLMNRPAKGGASHSRKILPAVDFLLRQADLELEDIDAFSAALGPGSFTGLRIGLSIMEGFSLATGRPIVGVPTLEAMASSMVYARQQVCPVIDAKKGEVYCALFRMEGETLRRVTEDMVLKPESLCHLITEPTIFIGDGIRAYGDLFRSHLGEKALLHGHFTTVSVAAQVARLAETALCAGKALREAKPIYIRPSEAEAKRLQRGGIVAVGYKRSE